MYVLLIVNYNLGSPAPQQAPAAAGQAAGDIQAQWAEYYRSLGYTYYGQQGQQGGPAAPGQGGPGQPPPPTTSANGDPKKV